ncbi:MAG: hypothetical protein ACRD7E_31570 [Bryobacteraceae bacterium]
MDKRLTTAILWAIVMPGCFTGTLLHGQERQNTATMPRDETTLQALLAEVRQLRLALERSAVTVPRIQVVLQRMQMQQNRVDQMSQRLQDLRSKLGTSASEDAQLAAHVKEEEARLIQEQDPGRRRDLENRIQAVKEELERQSSRGRQQQAQEIELSGQLHVEQAKLDDLARLLTAPEASLASK